MRCYKSSLHLISAVQIENCGICSVSTNGVIGILCKFKGFLIINVILIKLFCILYQNQVFSVELNYSFVLTYCNILIVSLLLFMK